MAEPVLKWAGGKRQLLDELYERFPEEFSEYHEPFFGAGALFFDLEPEGGSINDTNVRLVNFYEVVRDSPDELLEVSRSFRHPESDPDSEKEFSSEDRKGKDISQYYYQQRELFNRRPAGEDFDEVEEAALLMYLNRTGYNGLYRENSNGGFNVPIGRYSNPDWVRESQVREASRVLEGTSIFNQDFEYVLEVAQERDLVYCDPPYQPMSATANFTDYSEKGFDRDDQERLLEVARRLDEAGIHVILSNSGVMFDFYDESGFYVEVEGATRAINSDANNRDEVDEIIATNISPNQRGKSVQKGLTDF